MTDESVLSHRAFYDEMAPFYDRCIEETRLQCFTIDAERQFVVDLLGSANLLLDLGCGTGRTMHSLQESGRHVVGIDASRNMAILARRKGLNVLVAMSDSLPFPNGCFDALYSVHMGFGYCADLPSTVKLAHEVARILRPGGIAVMDTPHAAAKGREYLTHWRAGGRTISTMSYGKFKEELAEALASAGFNDCQFFGTYDSAARLDARSRRVIVAARKYR